MVSSTSAWLAGVVWAVIGTPTHAQIYKFESLPVPAARNLQTLYAFYVYSHHDAPDTTLGQPFVKFHAIEVQAPAGSKASGESGIELTMLPYTDFWKYIDPTSFCEAQRGKNPARFVMQLPAGGPPESFNVFRHKLDFNAVAQDKNYPVRETGIYVLAISNCGDTAEWTVRGSVIVKNAYGFLPGNEYHKIPFYGTTSLAYGALAFLWMVLSFMHWRELFSLQYCIAAVIFFGLIESFVWLLFYNDWNSSGDRGQFLFTMAILSSVVKSIFSYMLVLVAALGWGVTRPYLDHRTILKIQAMSAVYIVLDFAREWALSFRHSHSFSLAFVVLCLLPVSLLNGVIFYWIFSALSNIIELLKERRQADKLLLFQRLWSLLLGAMSVASIALIFQVFELSQSITTRWKYQWFVADGIPHILFIIVLMVIMFLWSPAQNAKRYAYQAQGDDEDSNVDGKAKNAAQSMWNEDGEDDEEDESFWAQTQTQTS